MLRSFSYANKPHKWALYSAPFVLLVLSLVSACVTAPPPKPDRLVLVQSNFAALTGWENDHLNDALTSFVRSCQKLVTLPVDDTSPVKKLGGSGKDWRAVCAKASALQGKGDYAIKTFFEQNFVPFHVHNNEMEEGLFTGYHEIDLEGSVTKTSHYTEPLYRLPRVPYTKPFYSRKEINEGALAGKNLEMLYINDPVKVFFLHIQGSGRVRLEDGRIIRVGYAEQNGHPYVAIGRCLIERGVLDKKNVSARAIKAWLYSHPSQAKALMELNPSYVFFREIIGEGPIGAEGVPLTPERSLAVDKRFIPYGLPVWLETSYPETPTAKTAPLQKLFITQDTGGAIRGPVRGDVFFGNGDRAEMLAEYMKNKGRYTILLPLSLAARVASETLDYR